MPTRNHTDWMWAEACDLLDQADRMHRQFFRPAGYGRPQGMWEPPVDVFEDELELVIVVALPGVPADRIEVTTESGELVVRAEPPPVCGSAPRGAPAGNSVRSLRTEDPAARRALRQ